MKILWEKKVNGDKYGDWVLSRYLVKLDKTYNPEDKNYELISTFYIPRCGHEHDCCGCLSSYIVETMFAGGSYVVVEVSYTRNV